MRSYARSTSRRAWQTAVCLAAICLALIWPGAAPQAAGGEVLARATDRPAPASPGATDPASPGGLPLGDVLNPDGTLDLTAGYQGSLDPRGWRLVSSAGEPPRFAPAHSGGEAAGLAPLAVPGDELWSDEFAMNGANGRVNAMVVSGSSVYLGGAFTSPGRFVARWDGFDWHALGSGLSDPVEALALSGSHLYAGGGFHYAGDLLVNHIAMWDGAAWHALGSGTVGTSSDVAALAADGAGNVYAGGSFSTAGGVTALCIARWNEGSSAWYPVGYGAGLSVIALAWGGGWLYAGGSFTEVFTSLSEHVEANHVAMWNGSSWQQVRNGLADMVLDLAYDSASGKLYAANGSCVLGQPFRVSWCLPAGADWQTLGAEFDWRVDDVALDSAGKVYAGGDFTSPVTRVASWNGGSWSAVGAGTDGEVMALAAVGTNIYAGGAFTQAGGVEARHIALWNASGASWSTLVDGGADGIVRAVRVSGPYVYFGGDFHSVGGLEANHVARWDTYGGRWSALGSGVDNDVKALAVDFNGHLYAGGLFANAGGVPAAHIAHWNGSSWSAMGPGANNVVWALAAHGTTVYAGGTFTMTGGLAVEHVASWNGSSWSALGGGVAYPVMALAVTGDGTTLYAAHNHREASPVGGVGTQAPPGYDVGVVERWASPSWAELGQATGYVRALVVDGSGDLYAGGDFNSMGDTTAPSVAKWSGSAWQAVGAGFDSSVLALAIGPDGKLYAGGSFTYAGSTPANRIARWDGASWSALGSGIAGYGGAVYALARLGDCDLYVGGDFRTAGDKTSPRVARRRFLCRHCHLPLVLR